MIRVFVLLLGFGVPLSHAMTNATYNSFRQQIGYCKMQSFGTVSRSTSGSVPMFMDGRIRFGVGLSDFNMRASDAELCGMCLRVTSGSIFLPWCLIDAPMRFVSKIFWILTFIRLSNPSRVETLPIFHGLKYRVLSRPMKKSNI